MTIFSQLLAGADNNDSSSSVSEETLLSNEALPSALDISPSAYEALVKTLAASSSKAAVEGGAPGIHVDRFAEVMHAWNTYEVLDTTKEGGLEAKELAALVQFQRRPDADDPESLRRMREQLFGSSD